MCLIIHKPAGITIPSDLIRSAWEDNSDGTGIMYRGADGPRVYRVMPKDWADPARHIEQVLAQLTDTEVGIHFRWKTHGPVTRENVHPFAIPGSGGYIMHNGIISDKLLGPHYAQVKHVMSDTAFYTLTALGDAPGADDETFWELVGADVGSYNKMLVMDAAGRFRRINDSQWDDYKGLRLSNLLSCPGHFDNWRGTAVYGGMGYEFDPDRNTTGTKGSKDDAAAVLIYTGTSSGPEKLTRRERKVLNACLRAGHWGPFNRLAGKGRHQ